MSGSAERFAARARQRRRAALRPVLWATAVAAVLGTLAWAVLGSGLLGVRRVTVVGAHRLSADTVAAAADVRPGHPLLTLDLAGIRHRVGAVGAVAKVRVVRDWPGTVRIEVTERVPVAVVRAGGGYRLVDRTGTAFWPVADRGRLPVLDVPAARPADPATRSALAVLAALPAGVRHRVRTVQAPSAAAVRLVLRDGKAVVWGTAGDADRKAEVLAALLHRPGRVYDVSTPDVASIR